MTDDTPDYSDEWADLTEKEILIGILTELQVIRVALTPDAPTDAESDPLYRCTHCGTEVTAEERHQHAREQHKAPIGMDLGDIFERVDNND